MSVVYVTSDWHFGHSGITDAFRTQFGSLEQMENHIMDNTLDIIRKRDVLYCLGDMSFTRDGLKKIDKIPCRKILVRGNHDTLSTWDYMGVFDEIEGAIAYKGYFLTHIPIHPSELYRRKNIHGHCHRGGPDGPSYFNAILEFNNYKPVSMQEVNRMMELRKEI